MKKIRLLLGPALVPVLVAGAFIGTQTQVASSAPVRNRVLQRALAIELGDATRAKWEMPLSSGVVYAVLEATGEIDARVKAAPRSARRPQIPSKSGRTQGCPNVFGTVAGPANVRVNQDCGRRRQAEEVVVENPTNPNNLIAGQNDSRNGFNQCGYDWSLDGGGTWGDQVPPFYQFQQLDGRTADACSDPTVTFDSVGNAYVGGILFNVAATASSIVVQKSNAGIGGQFYHTPVPGAFQEYLVLPPGVVANDDDACIFHDKEFIVADAWAASPKSDNVYATWTRFDSCTGEGVGANSPIYFSQSTDGGATWSPGVEISGSNPAICTIFSGSSDPFACDQDQGSHPIVGSDGTIYVAFGNGNTPLPGINQVVFVKCPAAADCSQSASWTPPVKINDLIDNHPTGPDPDTGCPGGRQCLPPNGYRVPEFTSITASIDSSQNLYVSWSDFRNGGPPCVGPASTATPPCDNDVFYSTSTDGGATWSPEVNIAPASEVGVNAQWQPWSDVRADGQKLFVAYYDRRYGNCEFDGCNDITLAIITNPITGPSISYRRITTASMPNLVPANNPAQAGFLGDYMWVDVGATKVHIVWADTRGLNDTVEEDIYYAFVRA